MSKAIALVTYNENPDLLDGETLIWQPLINAGFEPKAIPWDSKNVAWNQFEAVILRSSWDYHTRIDEFKAWLCMLESSGTNVWNRVSTIRWNMDKHYLGDLAQKGISIIPTHYIERGASFDLPTILNNLQTSSVIVKPTFGASAFHVARFEKQKIEEIRKQVNLHLQSGDVMIQPFMDQIEQEGEYSFIFFGKQFSHAVLKKPSSNDFRTQPAYGGTEHFVVAPHDLVYQAGLTLNTIQDPLLYARVDGINVGGKLLLMELELIEPYLFFDQDQMAAPRFVSVLLNYLIEFHK